MKINRPFDLLEQAKDRNVQIELEDGEKISGVLRCFDSHLNLVIENAKIGNKQYPLLLLRAFKGSLSIKE